ncbi:MAG: Xaa-Pro aminopeptidase [Thermodesulfobacteriota bacterium]|nr:Xaa-Pro aminopeptidase [Thermodesulfobacteriota bacterium]
MSKALEAIRAYMITKKLDAVLFNSSEYLTSSNVRYITQFTGSEAAVLVTLRDRHLFTDGRYTIQARQQAQGYTIHVTKDTVGSVARLVSKWGYSRIGIEPARLTYKLVSQLRRRVPMSTFVDMDKRFLENFRIHKLPQELEKIRNAAAVASEACKKVLWQGIVGKTEADVAWELESEMRRLGADEPSFSTIVASGERSALPHAHPSKKIIFPGDLVVMDYGARLSGYNSDETVTCVVGGSPTPLQEKMHEAVYEAHNRAIESLRIGIPMRQIDQVARQCIDRAGFGRHFIHGLGHGVGLEVHEPPRISQSGKGLVEQGMVFTIEPGIYLEGIGGVRLESLVHMSGDGPELLSLMPKKLISVA